MLEWEGRGVILSPPFGVANRRQFSAFVPRVRWLLAVGFVREVRRSCNVSVVGRFELSDVGRPGGV